MSLSKTPSVKLFESFGYTVGFIVVIFGRLQLFTENTITVVIPLLAKFNITQCLKVLKLWGIVFVANIIGVATVAAVTVFTKIVPLDLSHAILEISQSYISRPAYEFFSQGIPAGFIIAAIVWMIPSAENNKLGIVAILTYFIYLGNFTHVIAGSGEVFVMVFHGDLAISNAILKTILPTFCGNVIGGSVLFTLLAYGQVKDEL